MTFLFTDIEGSTRQWEESPEMYDRVERHFVVMRAAVDDGGGDVFSTMGDGIAAAFTSVDGAVLAAVAAQRQMPSIGLSARMGIHTGEVERVGDDYRGRSVNRAARIMAVGHGGQILLSDVSAALARSGSSRPMLADLGTHRLRDLTDPERLWQVVHPELRGQFPPVRGLDAYSNNLPAQRSSLVGRDRDVQRVIDLTRRHRIVTLTGVGGVGKTRLAVHAAAEMVSDFATVCFVELACVADPGDVADTIGRALGGVAAVDPLAAAAASLAGGRRLLVLDNCEHVIDSVASAIDVLTEACPDLCIVATSREVLGVDGEHVHAVRSLEPATTALDLFRQRAAAAGVDLATLDRASIVELCRRLDGNPLAIELAAARTATLGISTITGALADRLGPTRGARRRADDRHATMRATIEWSYRLLDADEQRMRYRMLETMRAFALGRLDECDERLAALIALAQWMTTLTDLPVGDPCNAAVERNAVRLEREADNWREAVVVATRLRSGELAAALCGPPVAFFLLGRHDLADVVRPLLELCDSDQRRSVLTALIVSASGATEPSLMQAWAEEVQRIDDSDDSDATGLGGLMRWMALAWRGDFVEAIGVCVAASTDERLRQGTRDMFVGIAVLDHFSLTDATSDTRGLIPRALEVADRSDVALHRATCLLGAAWGIAESDPERALQLVSRAINEVPNVPALTRLTLPGSASRLLTRLEPRVAARGLLEQLDATTSRQSFVDLIPLFYAATLLDGLRDRSAEHALITVTAAPVEAHTSMMDVVDLSRRAASISNPASVAPSRRPYGRRWPTSFGTTVRPGS